eukprot:NODE_290_length_10614_cov_1.553590.p5 type:complete len:283 gc:universal NODE_290_length_10614_cov_1.553590:7406-8254(+)
MCLVLYILIPICPIYSRFKSTFAKLKQQMEQATLSPKHQETSTILGHTHYSHRTQMLRALLLGANDGLVSVAALLMGITSGSTNSDIFGLAGVSAIVAGSLSMACGEYISVASQRDSERADIQKEIEEQNKGPEAQARELEQLTAIYIGRGLSRDLAKQVAQQLTEKDVIKAHARDEHGIDLDELDGWGSGLANPIQAAITSAIAFIVGGIVPLLCALWVPSNIGKIIVISIVTCITLIIFGIIGANLGGSSLFKGAFRNFVGGVLALGVSFGVGQIFHVQI